MPAAGAMPADARTLASLYKGCSTSGADARTTVADALCLAGTSGQTEALSDLFTGSLAFACGVFDDDEKVGVYTLLLKEAHEAATGGLLTVDAAFQRFKDSLLQRCVHRPPKSVGLYSLADANLLMEHALCSYFRYYKLYQYAFASRHFLDIKLGRPPFETALASRPLQQALTEEEWQQAQMAKDAVRAEEQQRLAEEAAAAAEEERVNRLLHEYEAAVPDDMAQYIALAVHSNVEALRKDLEQQLIEKEAGWLQQVKHATSSQSG